MRKKRRKKSCYFCKKCYNPSTRKHCPNMHSVMFGICDEFEWAATYKSFNARKKR